MPEPVDVWVVPLQRTRAEIEALLQKLSPEERMRAGERPRGPRKRRYVARQAALRELLAARTGIAPESISFVRSDRGKPELAGDHDVRFSVSDSEDVALVAVAGREVGVDVERIRDRPAAARAGGLGIDRFFERWTRLEATAKARGEGVFGRLDGDGLTCTSLDVGPGFAAAVAVAADEADVRVRPY